MRFQTRSFRPALTGGLLAAVLLWLPTVAQAATVTIAKSNVPGTPVEGGDTVSDFTGAVSVADSGNPRRC
jgi:TctA family transporter